MRVYGLFSQYSVPFVERREKEPNVDAACVPFFQVAWKKHLAGDAVAEIRITFDPQAFFAQTSGRSYAPTDGRSGGEGGGAAGAPFVCSLFVPAELDGARTLHRLPVVVYTGAVHVTAPGVSLVPPFCRAVAPPPPRQRAAKPKAKAAPPAPPWAAMANVSAVCKLCEPTVARAVIAEIGGICLSPLGAGGEHGGDAAVAAAAEAAEPPHPSATQTGAAQCSDVVADGGVVVVDLGTVAVHSRATAVLKVQNFNPEAVTLRGPFRGPRASGMGLLSPEVQFSLTDIQASGVAKAALHLARGLRGLFVHSKGVLIPEISGAFSGGDALAAAAADDDYYADDYGDEEDAEALSLTLPSCAFPAPHATIQHVVNGTAATRRTNNGGAYSAATLPSEHAADFELAVLATLPSVQQRPCAAAAAAAGAAAAAADLRDCLSHYVVTGLDLFTAGGRVQWAWSDVEIDGLHLISTAVAAGVSVTGAVRSSLVVQAQLGWPAFVESRRLSFGVVRAGQRYTQHLHVVNPFAAPVRVALAAAADEPTRVVNSPYRVTPCARCVTWQTGNSSSGSGGATTELQQPEARCGALFTDVYLRSNATRLERVSVVAYVGHGRLSVAQLAKPGDGYRGECADCGVDAGDGGVDLAGSCSCDTTEEMAALHGIGDSVTSSDTDFMITDSRRSWQFDVPPSHLNATVPCACDDDHADAEQRCSSLARDVACSGYSGSGDGDCYDVDGADPVQMCPRTCYKQQHVRDGGSSGAGGGGSAARACHAPRPMAATWSIANMGTVPMRVLDIALAPAAPAAANDTEAAAAAGLARHCEAGGFTLTHCDALKAFEPFELAPGESVLAGVTYAPSCVLRAAAAAAPLEPAAELVVLTSDGEHAVTLTPRYVSAGYDVCDELAPLEVLPLPLLSPPPPPAPADATEGAEAPWYYTWTFWIRELHADAALDRRLRRCALVRVYAALRLLQQKRQGLRLAEVQAAADAADRELRRALRWLNCNDTAAAAMSPDEEAAADARAAAEAARATVHAAEQRLQRLQQEQQMWEQLWAGAVAVQQECARQLRAAQPVVAARWQQAYAAALQGAAAGAAAARGAGAHAAAAAADAYSAASAAAADACAAEQLRLTRFGASIRSAFAAVLPAPAERRRAWQLLCTVSRWAMRAADAALLITLLASLYLPRDFASGVFLLKTLLLAVAARALRAARLRGQQRRLPPPWRVLMPVLNMGVNGLLFGFVTIPAPQRWPVLYTLGLVFAGVNVVASRQQRRRDALEAAAGAAAAQPLAQPPPPLLRRAANSAWELLHGLVTTVLDAAMLIVGWYMVPHLWFTDRYNHASKIEFALCLWRRGAAWFALNTNEAAAPAPAPAHSIAAAAAQLPAAAAQPAAAAAQPVAAQSAARAVNDLPPAAAAQPPAAAAHAPQLEQIAAPKALAAAAAPRSRRRGGQRRRGGSKSSAPVVRAAVLKGGPAAAPEAALLSKPAAAASLLVRQLPSRSTSTSSSTSSDTEYPPAKRAVAGDRTEAPVAGIAGDAAAALMASAAAAAAAPGAAEAQAGAALTGSAAEVADTAAAALALAAVLGIAAPSLHGGRSGSTAAAAAAAAPPHSPARSAGGQAAAVKGGVSQAELAKEAEEKGVEVAAGAGGGASGSGRRRKRKAAGAQQQPQQQPAPAAAAAPKPPAPHHQQQQQVTAPNAPTAPARNGAQRAPAEPAAGAQPRTAPKAAASDAAAKDRGQSKVVAAGGKAAAGGANGSKSGVGAARATTPASAPKAAAAARAAQVASAPKAAAEVRAEAAEGREGGSSAQVLSAAHASDGGGALEANGSSQAGGVDGGSGSGAVTPTSLLLSLLGKDDGALPPSPPRSGPLRAPPGLEHCRRTPPVAALNKQPPALVHSADTARSTSPDVGDNSSSEPMAAAGAAAAAAVAAAATPVGGTPERAAAAATVPLMSWSRPPLFQLATEVAGSSASGDSSSGRHFAVSDTPPVRNPADTAAAAAAAATAAVPTHQRPDASSGPGHHATGLMAGVAPPMHGDASLSAAAGALPSVRHGFDTDVLGFGLDAAWGTLLPPERNGSVLAESSPFGAIGSGRHGSDATAAAAAAPAVASSAFVGGGMRSAIAPLAPRGEGGGRTIGAAHVLSMDAGADDDINDILAMTFDVDEAEGDADALPAPAYDRISGGGGSSSGGGGGGVDGGISRGSSGRSEHMLLSPAMFTDRAALLQSDERSAYSRSSAGAGGGSGGSGGAPPGFSSFLTPSFFASTANENVEERAEEGEGGG
ncbi:hypothetical protein JKP88DRAFT_317406 [Tribonema minus]|uniref:Uncharacterized protein n=1 Tax=Tribonema minus TaxID=303371 RepID=A0A835Z178_9STRA|nr:hypothetical protein JKP88DRAFT_317406 [Tribonema minus]